ncbi:hypothetical protein CERSUDRAFT_154684 [Gelatoporia subvermispora B]|uniref:Cytochrome P450 n=1 Tax=Ceriporiopsis subvermispora (strain B) TaxID=914234 RepID=M2RH36_CERS8|nr:hypothetical protein CERSUDRAFT_154684 [Gelatoporia subvermispora B]
MASLTEIVTLLGALAIAAWLLGYLRRAKMVHLPLPPGPPRLPILGNTLDIPRASQVSPSQAYLDMSRSLGSEIICLTTIGDPVIVLNSRTLIDDLLEGRSSIYSDRPWMTMLNELAGLDWTISILPYGEEWRLCRKMFQQEITNAERNQSVQSRHTFGFMSRLLRSPEQFIDHIHLMSGATMLDLTYALIPQSGEDRFVQLAEQANQVLGETANAGVYLVDAFPTLKHIPSWMPGAGFKRTAAKFRQISVGLLEEPFKDVKERISNGTVPDCAAVSLMETFGRDAEDAAHTEVVIKKTLASIHGAGADTTASTLSAFFLAMTLFPEVQYKAQRELDSVLSSGRFPELCDKPSLPYITAVVKESLRWKPVLPLDIVHRLMVDDHYHGYLLPRGSLVVANIRALLYDEIVYPGPSRFNPDRFIKNGELDPNVPDPTTAAFGFGRRICPGRHFVQDLLWITFASILTAFTISKAVDERGMEITPDAADSPGLISHPKPFQCKIRPRSNMHAEMVAAAAG